MGRMGRASCGRRAHRQRCARRRVAWLTRRLAPPPLWVMAMYYASLIGRCVCISRSAGSHGRPFGDRRRSCALASGFWIVATPTLSTTPQPLRVTFLDVGQGDAAIVQFPDGRTLSIDAGGLASHVVRHRRAGHRAGVLGARRSPARLHERHAWRRRSHRRRGEPVSRFQAVRGVGRRAGAAARADARAARAGGRRRAPSGERCSRRDRVSFGQRRSRRAPPAASRLGAPARAQRRLRGARDSLWRRVVRVHRRHRQGSRADDRAIASRARRSGFSRCLTTAARPRARSRFSTRSGRTSRSSAPGAGTRSDIPVPSVLERYRDIGAAIYRTDQDGAVTVETDGTTVRVSTFTGRRLTLTTRRHDTTR